MKKVEVWYVVTVLFLTAAVFPFSYTPSYLESADSYQAYESSIIPYGTIITCPVCRKDLYKCISVFATEPKAADYEPIGDTPPPINNTRTLCPFCKAELWDEFQKHLRRYR